MYLSKNITQNITSSYTKNSLSYKLRRRRILPLLKMIHIVHANNGKVSIVDIGGTREYWNILSEYFIKQYKIKITIINLEEYESVKEDGPFEFIIGDACDIPLIENNSFDISHSNSVIEHVGDWERMKNFSKEIKRIAPKYFIQTPNYWFPIEPHCMTLFFHWLPMPIRIWLAMRFQLGNWNKAKSVDDAMRNIERIQLLNKKMFKQLFPEAEIIDEKLFGLNKSMVAIKK